VDMQVAAFGHLPQKGQLKSRLPPDGFQIARSALLRASAGLRQRRTGKQCDDLKNRRPSYSRHSVPATECFWKRAFYLMRENVETTQL
jgi:hypothetical protein